MALYRPGESALLMPEQFAFEEVRRQRGAVHRDEWSFGPARGLVDGAGDDFFARTGFACDQNRDVGVLDPLDDFTDAQHFVVSRKKLRAFGRFHRWYRLPCLFLNVVQVVGGRRDHAVQAFCCGIRARRLLNHRPIPSPGYSSWLKRSLAKFA